MGQGYSTANLTEPVTLPRIWNACQLDSNMPAELKKFNIHLLANDMNKLGANIPTTGSLDSTCSAIHSYIPKAEKVCMIGKNASKQSVFNVANLFNKQYGTRIPIHKNGVDGEYRPVADICDDLYLVQKRVYRELNNNTIEVKKKLLDSIQQLRAQQKMLDAEFSQNQKYLSKGARLDGINKNVQNDLAMQQLVVNQMNGQLNAFNNMYNQYYNGLTTFAPYAKRTANAMNGIGLVRMSGGGSGGSCAVGGDRDEVSGETLNKLYGGAVNMALAMQSLTDCFKHMNTTYEEYVVHAGLGEDELRNWVTQKKNEALMDPQNRGRLVNETMIGQCAQSLIEQGKYVLSAENTKGYVKESFDKSCHLNNMFHKMSDRQYACSRDSMCAWVNGTCQLNDNDGVVSYDSTSRFIEFNPYTIRALGQLRKYITFVTLPATQTWVDATGDNSTGADVETYKNKLEQLFTGMLFTDMFSQKVLQFPNLSKLMETRSADPEGVRVNPYMAHVFGDLLKFFAKYLIAKYSLRVPDRNQDSLLMEAFEAYINNESTKYIDLNPEKKIFTITSLQQELQEFMFGMKYSHMSTGILNKHDTWVAGYLMPNL